MRLLPSGMGLLLLQQRLLPPLSVAERAYLVVAHMLPIEAAGAKATVVLPYQFRAAQRAVADDFPATVDSSDATVKLHAKLTESK